jgi:hypothetical protein
LIAQRTGKSPDEARRSTKARDFLKWAKLIEDEWNEHSKQDYYMAQVAYWVYLVPYRILGGKPEKQLEDFLIPFTVKVTDEDELQIETDPTGPEDLSIAEKLRIQEEKSFFLAALGLDADGNNIPGHKTKVRPPPDIPANREALEGMKKRGLLDQRNNPIITKPKKDENGH